MAKLHETIPDPDVLLALAPEELAPHLLQIAKENLQNGGMFTPSNLHQVTSGAGMTAYQHSPYARKEKDVELALAEAWNWLQVQGLIVPAEGINGANGWMRISRRGATLRTNEDFTRFREAAQFPKALLHPLIADKVWLDLARGDLADAVFTAYRTVEEAVRRAGGYGASEIGVPLMRRAFDPTNGPLSDSSQEKSEAEALSHLFAAAIGSYKNPHSHRTVSITDPKEAQEMVMLASHLLRIVDARAALKKKP